jgi:hypothetical protein
LYPVTLHTFKRAHKFVRGVWGVVVSLSPAARAASLPKPPRSPTAASPRQDARARTQAPAHHAPHTHAYRRPRSARETPRYVNLRGYRAGEIATLGPGPRVACAQAQGQARAAGTWSPDPTSILGDQVVFSRLCLAFRHSLTLRQPRRGLRRLAHALASRAGTPPCVGAHPQAGAGCGSFHQNRITTPTHPESPIGRVFLLPPLAVGVARGRGAGEKLLPRRGVAK